MTTTGRKACSVRFCLYKQATSKRRATKSPLYRKTIRMASPLSATFRKYLRDVSSLPGDNRSYLPTLSPHSDTLEAGKRRPKPLFGGRKSQMVTDGVIRFDAKPR